MTDTQVMDLPDGRELAWWELGDPNGPPVMGFHGTPGSRRQVAIGQTSIAASGVRFIAPDRPGYGHSTYHRRRRLDDWATDVARLADHLHLEQFAVFGVSGGGPHAAACARSLPGRLTAAGIVSGVAPMSEPGAEEGMTGFGRLAARLARHSVAGVYPLTAITTQASRRWPERALTMARRELPDADVAVLGRPDVRAAFVEALRRAPPTQSRAQAQDFALFAQDWGFRLEDITVPVHLWHGDQDRTVPVAHGRLLAERIPGASLHECPGEGHFLVIDHLEEILRTLTSQGRRDNAA